ncbi:MAG: hemolysin III family protein [Ruminococcaceae bacterium]|nr:hemolysin III family protein [Oscillospiraceae bacterium]
MTRTALKNRVLPDYTKGEEIFNMVTHIVGGALGIIVLVTCVLKAAIFGDAWGVVTSAIYGGSMVALYAVSSVYHGLTCDTAKKVMQVIDHCTIYLLIAGTYTPILLCSMRTVSPIWAWGLLAFVWGLAILAATLTAIDLKKYSAFSMVCYILMGWCIVAGSKVAMAAIEKPGLAFLLAGGIAYTVGAVLYGAGKKVRYMHSVFHIFVVLGSLLQYFSIIFYVI